MTSSILIAFLGKAKRRILVATLCLIAFLAVTAGVAHAERVAPRDTVTSSVNIRSAPSASSASLGVLRPGEHLDYVGSVPRWHEIRLVDDQRGFVSKRWTEVVPDAPDASGASTFSVHFLDVGTGDAAIIDIGEREIIIDGGNFPNDLRNYLDETGILDGPIELVIVTHGDSDHWKGLVRLLGFDGIEDDPPAVLEFWEPGYDRDCNPSTLGARQNYLAFVEDMQGIVPSGSFLRPLENHHTPASKSGVVEPFTVASLPGVRFTVLHSDSSPSTGSCSYLINNASIVLMIEIDGIRFLFTGDANGKERDARSPVAPSHVEGALLVLEDAFPGALKADVLKAPHHGSETANTAAFIDAVDPKFVVISASTTHHLPRDTVVSRYQDGQRIILRTDASREKAVDHIVCAADNGALDCNFSDVFE